MRQQRETAEDNLGVCLWQHLSEILHSVTTIKPLKLWGNVCVTFNCQYSLILLEVPKHSLITPAKMSYNLAVLRRCFIGYVMAFL